MSLSILEEAGQAIHGDRNHDYGHPIINHSITADLWSTYLQCEITAEQVCMMNILQKVSRSASGVMTRDTLVDIAGYAGNVEMIQDQRELLEKIHKDNIASGGNTRD